MEVGVGALGFGALEHDQLPLGLPLIKAQDVGVAVATLHLEVAVLGAMPLIQVVGDIDLTPVEGEAVRISTPPWPVKVSTDMRMG